MALNDTLVIFTGEIYSLYKFIFVGIRDSDQRFAAKKTEEVEHKFLFFLSRLFLCVRPGIYSRHESGHNRQRGEQGGYGHVTLRQSVFSK